MKHLPDVTLCAIDTRSPELACAALLRCMQSIIFADVILFTNNPTTFEISNKIRVVGIDLITSIQAYSYFVMRQLGQHIQSSHVLLVQWDGFIRDSLAWRDEFLLYDYIGAPWPNYQANQAVGNGGFSLRSTKLLRALEDPVFPALHPEDVAICQNYRPLLEQSFGIQFAPVNVALLFSQERVLSPVSFGFHGAFHLPALLSPAELLTLVKQLPRAVTCSPDVCDLIRVLIKEHDPQLLRVAFHILKKRLFSARVNRHERKLWSECLYSFYKAARQTIINLLGIPCAKK